MGFKLLRSILGGQSLRRLYECRECGTTVQADTEACPACGSEGIAEYELD